MALAALILIPSLLVAQQQTPPPPAAPREATLPQPVEQTLDNGLRVIVVPKKNIPLVAARLLVKTGGEADPADHAGLAQMTASLLTKGTTTRTAEQIARGVEALGATLESGAAWDMTYVDVSVMSKNLPKAMEFVSDVVRNAKFADDEIERQRTQSIDELNVTLREPRPLAAAVASRVLFGAAPYGHNLAGTPESLQKITRGDLTKFHRANYRPDNAILVFAGDVDPLAAFTLAKTTFGTWKVGGPASAGHTELQPSPATPPRIVIVDMPDAGQSAIVVGRQGLRRSDPAYFQAIVTNSILGGGFSARLNQEIRIKRGLSYGAGSSFELRREAGPFAARTETKHESVDEVVGLMLEQLNRLGAEDINATELTPRKAVLIGGFGRGLETTQGIVNRVAGLALYGLPLSEINRYISGVQAVSAADVKSFAAKSLAASTANVVIVGDAKQFADKLRARFKNVEVIPIDELDLSSPALRKAPQK
jgi:zinc protease